MSLVSLETVQSLHSMYVSCLKLSATPPPPKKQRKSITPLLLRWRSWVGRIPTDQGTLGGLVLVPGLSGKRGDKAAQWKGPFVRVDSYLELLFFLSDLYARHGTRT